MSARRRHVVIRVSTDRRVILVTGWQVSALLREVGMKPLWSHVGKGWTLDHDRLPDVVALCEWQGIGVRIDDQREAG